MTSIRIPFESYAAQVAQQNHNSNHLKRNNTNTLVNNGNTKPSASFQFEPQITSFSIKSVEEEDPEEKMHSPRTPYRSVPDHVPNNRRFKFNNHTTNPNTLYPPHIQPIQRTVSASSFESIRSSSFEHENILHYAPTLSATSSITRQDLKAVYSTSTTPSASPCHTPKSYQLSLQESKMDDNDNDEDTEHSPLDLSLDNIKDTQTTKPMLTKTRSRKSEPFGEVNTSDAREDNITAISKALNTIKTQKKNGFVLYKHGLGTYSAAGSGANTTGTITPNSIGGLSRSSSCGSVCNGGSEYSFDDDAIDDGELELGTEFMVSSGCSTPVLTEALDVTLINEKNNNALISEDEMDTPVPMIYNSGEGCDTNGKKKSPFDFNGANYGLAEISEERESKMEFAIIDDVSDDDDDDEPLPEMGDKMCMDLEDEIILKGSRFQSSRILFLDVDGVLLSTDEQKTLGKGANIKFNDEVTSLMIKLYRETECDIVISSTWQFHKESHLPYLIAYLVACGWARNKIHILLDLLPECASDGIDYGREWYEQSPYCRCRARGIQKIVQLYGNYITRWCCLDDLPLHSQKPVCIPRKEDLKSFVDRVSNAYFKAFTWRQTERETLMPDIKYCVKYALTSLPNCIFSTQSYRFGYEYNQTMIYYQADAIAKLCKLTYEIKDNTTYQLILQNMMGAITQYIGGNLTYQGDPYITPYLVQTDQNTGITPQNIENTIILLTYTRNDNNYYNRSQNNSPNTIQYQNDPNSV